ncbi:hypothetical protein MUN88_16680 [Gracilibacillus caseinilyticus]|uniref:DUF1049 domain-containing protein n=1 Tax=Gracilibacillus caseinilyticus TaxID=2932256 RepID=A0ABY4EV26_9BACI|nr:hypothetical protein [Gracilibacillus caseinilyticus]UOQ47672.1 hypothetical protein MUN88_16680 [Gracilibacillus caseinilyticus]
MRKWLVAILVLLILAILFDIPLQQLFMNVYNYLSQLLIPIVLGFIIVGVVFTGLLKK